MSDRTKKKYFILKVLGPNFDGFLILPSQAKAIISLEEEITKLSSEIFERSKIRKQEEKEAHVVRTIIIGKESFIDVNLPQEEGD